MTSFGWKKKSGDKVSRTASVAFEENALNEEEIEASLLGEGEIDWLSLQQSAKRSRVIPLEDSTAKALRLKSEGAVLAEKERFWEAVKKWDASLDFNPNDETVYEMKAQAYMALSEVYPALTAAQKAVTMNPRWWVGYQTLGRAHLGLGEVRTAVLQFSRAIHINPAETELWEEDLKWAWDLLKQRRNMMNDKKAAETENDKDTNSSVQIQEINDEEEDVPEEKCALHRTSESLNDKDLITSTSRSKRKSSDNSDDQVIHVPDGYVKMRDVT